MNPQVIPLRLSDVLKVKAQPFWEPGLDRNSFALQFSIPHLTDDLHMSNHLLCFNRNADIGEQQTIISHHSSKL